MTRGSSLPGCRRGRACACGAQIRNGRGRACVKCVSRGRWARHKARRGFGDDGR